jgi:4'-phosphopantetheinyl transferase
MAGLKGQSRSWLSPSDHPALGTRDVHVWRASLASEGEIVERFRRLLSDNEQARADRFHFEIDRRHFIVARGWLRTLLGRYLEVDPANVGFAYEAYGKPKIPSSVGQECQLNFNLAHSNSLGLYAFTRLGEIGIDIEHIQREFTGDDIARRFFSASEVASLSELPPELRHNAFFNCWTRKEAFIKAKGTGLSLSLDQFDVTLTPGKSPALLRTRWDEEEAALWSLKEIDAGPGYVAAVALEAHDWELSQWQADEKSIA